MTTENINRCDLLQSYFLNECSQQERNAFEEHLRVCSHCKKELHELSQAWAMLPHATEELEVPVGLKAEIMDSIFMGHREDRHEVIRTVKRPKFVWIYSISVAILLCVITALLWNTEPQNSTTQVVKEYHLTSTDETLSYAQGNVWIVRQGEQTNFMMHISGLPLTQGEEVYQAWLIKDGKRYNCGTFQVNEQGIGALYYSMDATVYQFDEIGITLEPDANGSEPRGKKVLGTIQMN